MGIPVELVDARNQFLRALKGLTDPEEKRQAITDTFYRDVFAKAVKRTKATFLLHGTILTDIEETVAGIKRQHNILAQIGIDPQKAYGYKVLEPLATLRKDGVRRVAALLGLPQSITKRIPFPGPALATRIVGEVTRGEAGHRAQGHRHRGGGTPEYRRIPVPGGAAQRLRHRHSPRQTRIRADHRGALH